MKPTALITFLFVIASATLLSCGKNSDEPALQNIDSSSNNSLEAPPEEVAPEPPSSPIEMKPSICSDLSFDHVKWPSTLTDFHINIFALAMNISGSFEGHTGWTNLTNNFDGQGVSLGLFNQNLGQGSLQPLMIRLRQNSLTKFKSFYPKNQYDSVNGMLTKWGGVSNSLSKVTNSFDTYESDFSDLDDPEAIELLGDSNSLQLMKASSSKNQVSVDWAVKNVFNGKSFKPEWKTAFQKMAGSPEFVTIQVTAAKAIHDKAMGYMKKFGFKEMRAYFFFFDIVVQNGGISTTIANKYLAWEKSNKSQSEITKLKKLLEYRLALVINKYRNDVKSRKHAVIDGKGTVHGEKRDFSKEYCSPQWTAVFPKSSLP